MLNHGPSKRYNLNQIKNHLWFKKKFKDSGTPMINSIFPVFLHLLYFWFWFCICTPLSFIRVSKFLLLVWFCNPIILWFNEKKEDLKSLSMSGTIVTLVNHLNSGSDWYLVWRDLHSNWKPDDNVGQVETRRDYFSFSSFSLRLTFSLVVKLYDFIFTHSVHKARLPKQRTALYSAPTAYDFEHLHLFF